jgi:hypothetical protein
MGGVCQEQGFPGWYPEFYCVHYGKGTEGYIRMQWMQWNEGKLDLEK